MNLHAFERDLLNTWPEDAWDVSVLIGVSGGADSVALLKSLHEVRPESANGRLIVAHYNHQLRGEDSAADANFVQDLAVSLDLTSEIGSPDQQIDSDEESLRDARYAFFRQTADRCGARYIALAHTADDQVETVLHRIIRGTGLGGLTGIPRIRRLSHATSIVRPLLSTTRVEIINYLLDCGQEFRIDASNSDQKYTRNRIRHQLLPLLEESFNPQVREAIRRLSETATEAEKFVATQVEQLMRSALIDSSPQKIRIDRKQLTETPKFLVQEFFRSIWQMQKWPQQAMTQSHWEALATLVTSTKQTQIFPGGLQVDSQHEFITIVAPEVH
jgi:tRNA(Ile)-lysidine synthase